MKKLLLASSALVGVAAFAAPASAALKLDLGGYFQGYGVYSDVDTANTHEFDFRRDNEIHVNGETTLDNGLTVGAHTELNIGNTSVSSASTTYTTTISAVAPGTGTVADGATFANIASNLSATTSATGGTLSSDQLVDETYLYASGGWGRVNFGEEDGAAYLLQVAAPSADSNVDGLRVYIQALDTASWDTSLSGVVLSYQQADFQHVDRLTYLTPKFNGFQAGVSYAPRNNASLVKGGTADVTTDNDAGQFENLLEGAARWDGEFSGVALGLGAGYSHASTEADATTGIGSDALKTWNAGANVGFGGFSLGGAYKHSNNGVDTNGDTRTWVVGGAYDNGPYHAGVSYLNTKFDGGLLSTTTTDGEVDRYTVGGGYTFGPGLTFRGAVAWGNYEQSGVVDKDFTQVTVGTDVQF